MEEKQIRNVKVSRTFAWLLVSPVIVFQLGALLLHFGAGGIWLERAAGAFVACPFVLLSLVNCDLGFTSHHRGLWFATIYLCFITGLSIVTSLIAEALHKRLDSN
jgi:hypothetical protein